MLQVLQVAGQVQGKVQDKTLLRKSDSEAGSALTLSSHPCVLGGDRKAPNCSEFAGEQTGYLSW